jgi:hypothetical protein
MGTLNGRGGDFNVVMQVILSVETSCERLRVAKISANDGSGQRQATAVLAGRRTPTNNHGSSRLRRANGRGRNIALAMELVDVAYFSQNCGT